MSASPCDAIDGYLGNWLTEPERAAFAAHLKECPQCQKAMGEQQAITQLLAMALTSEAPVLAGLSERIEKHMRSARRRRLAGQVAALAALVTLACGVALWLRRPAHPESKAIRPDIAVAPRQVPQANDARPPAPVEVAFQGSSDVLALPIETHNPTITLIWVYPAAGKQAQRHKSIKTLPSHSTDRSGT
jgi:hypothetical protein